MWRSLLLGVHIRSSWNGLADFGERFGGRFPVGDQLFVFGAEGGEFRAETRGFFGVRIVGQAGFGFRHFCFGTGDVRF